VGARSNQVHRRLRARALRHKTPPFAAPFTALSEPQAQRFPAERVGWVPGATRCIGGFAPAHSGTKRLRFAAPFTAPTEPQAQRFPAERVGWVPGATRSIGGFAPAHSGTKRLRLRLRSRHQQSRKRSVFQRSASGGCPEQPGVSAASRPRTPAQNASVCGSVHGTNRAASAAFSSGARRVGARSNQVHRRLRARALRHKTPSFAAPFTALSEPQAQRFPAERVGWVPGATRCIGGFAPAHSGTKRLRLRLRSRHKSEPQAQRFPAERVGWVPGATRSIGGFAPAHSGTKRLRLRLRSRHNQSRKRSVFQRSASGGCPEQPGASAASRPRTPAQNASVCGSVHGTIRAASAAFSSGARRVGARSNQVYRRLRARALRHKTPSFAAPFTAPTEPPAQCFPSERVGWVPGATRCIGGFAPARTPAQDASVCGSVHGTIRAASAAFSSGARRVGARSNQVYRRLRARALRHKTPPFVALRLRSRHYQSRKRSVFQRSASGGCPEQPGPSAASRPRTPAQNASVCGSVHGTNRAASAFQRSASGGCPEQPGPSAASRPRALRHKTPPFVAPFTALSEPQAQRFPAERVGWVPGATRSIGGFAPARTPAQNASVCGSVHGTNRAASAAFSSGARRVGARSNQVHRRLRARAHSQNAFVCGSVHGTIRAASAAFSSGARRVGARSNQVHRRLRARAHSGTKRLRLRLRSRHQQSRKRSVFQRSASGGCPEQPGASAASRPRTPAQNAFVCGSVHGTNRAASAVFSIGARRVGARSNQVHRRLRARAHSGTRRLRLWLRSRHYQSRKRSVFQRSASGGCPEQPGASAASHPRTPAQNASVLRLCSRHQQSRKRSCAFQRSASGGCPEQPGPSAASRPRALRHKTPPSAAPFNRSVGSQSP
jgi:hypothetical protein